jgi:hypothetical protein
MPAVSSPHDFQWSYFLWRGAPAGWANAFISSATAPRWCNGRMRPKLEQSFVPKRDGVISGVRDNPYAQHH